MMLGISAYIIFNFGMFIFNYQNIDKVVGPCESSMSIMHFTGCLVNGAAMIVAALFLWFRIRGENSEEKKIFSKRGLQPQQFLLYLTTLKQKAKTQKIFYI